MKQKLGIILLAGLMIFCNGYADDKNSNVTTKPLEDTGLVDIGGGRKMYLKCEGTGSPTVILVSGRSDRSDIWMTADSETAVFPAVAKFTHICAYDRPGTVTIAGNAIEPSRSTSVPQPITPKDAVADLHALLTAAKVPTPLVLVGHSFGGLIVRLYASTYPSEVAGLVLIDTVSEFMYDALTPTERTMWVRLNSNYSPDLDKATVQEKTDLVKGFEQLRAAPALKTMPAIVLTSDQPYDFQLLIDKGSIPSDTPVALGSIIYKAHLIGQESLSHTLHARQITHPHSGHYIQTEQPQIVIDAIKEVVEKVRRSKPK